MVDIQRLSRTKIVCTIGPASEGMIKNLLKAGMSCARLNLAHGDIDGHIALSERIRRSSDGVAILADLPGPKIRLGTLRDEPVHLKRGAIVELNEGTESVNGSIPVDYAGFLKIIGNIIFINDGLIQLRVLDNDGKRARCRVLAGGDVLSHKESIFHQRGWNMTGKEI